MCEVEIMLDESRLDALKRAFSITDTEMGVVPGSAEKAVKELICERISLAAIQ